MVLFSEFAGKTASFILQGVYDRYRLWAMSPDLITFMRALDLKPIFGNTANVEELLGYLRVIEETDFTVLPKMWRQLSVRANDKSPGRVGIGADFVFYDPHLRFTLTEEDALVRANADRPATPDEHPRGFVCGESSDGWSYEVDRMDEEFVAPESDEEDEWRQSPSAGAAIPAGNVVTVPSPAVRGGGVCDTDIVRR